VSAKFCLSHAGSVICSSASIASESAGIPPVSSSSMSGAGSSGVPGSSAAPPMATTPETRSGCAAASR
jgi:hypothetical protein